MIKMFIAFNENCCLQVTDTRGYGDTRLNSTDKVKEFCECITAAMKANEGLGYHAFLFVLTYPFRLTEEEKDVFIAVKRIFGGKDVISKYGILVITRGDDFERKNAQTGLTIEQWCRNQDNEAFQEMLAEFGGRVVLLDNVTEDEAKQDAQVDRLLEVVESLPSGGTRYSDIFFQAASAELRTTIAASGECVIDQSIMKSTSLLMDKFEKSKDLEDQEKNVTTGESLQKWYGLLSRCDEMIAKFGEKGAQENTTLEREIVHFRATIEDFIIAKEMQRNKEDKWEAMLEAKTELRHDYVTRKAVRTGLIIGGCVLGAGALAASIAVIVLYPPSLRLVLRVSRVVFQLIKNNLSVLAVPLASSLLSVIGAVYKKWRDSRSKSRALPVDSRA